MNKQYSGSVLPQSVFPASTTERLRAEIEQFQKMCSRRHKEADYFEEFRLGTSAATRLVQALWNHAFRSVQAGAELQSTVELLAMGKLHLSTLTSSKPNRPG